MRFNIFNRKKEETIATQGIRIDFDPSKWPEHRFGLLRARWNNLKGKTIWITGAGTGYGRALSVALACAGAKLYLSGRREEKLRETAKDIKSYGIVNSKTHILPLDITDKIQVDNAVKRISEETDSLFGLIHCAALVTTDNNHPLQDYLLSEWENLFKTNVTAPWYLTREIFFHMMKGECVRIIFFSSGAGWGFTSGFGPYNVSKAAVNSLSTSLAVELSETYPGKDIQINTLQPGEARTEMNQGSKYSPFAVANMTLLLLSYPKGGPNGKFFHRDGRHLEFASAKPFEHSLNL
jgi:NAD(P)-dependent dehydrogenase (short-subunit alcohol dehydrogenase family)